MVVVHSTRPDGDRPSLPADGRARRAAAAREPEGRVGRAAAAGIVDLRRTATRRS